MFALQGSLHVLRAPRTRRLVNRDSMGLSELCCQVLLQLMRGSSNVDEPVYSSGCWELDECLDVLRGLVVEERYPAMNYDASALAAHQLKMIKDRETSKSIVTSHDKTFLAHICAFHTHLCRATGFLKCSRVLLYDIVRSKPNIKGLHLATTMIEIAPKIVEPELDESCRERPMLLKDTLLYALLVIAGDAATNRQTLMNETSLGMIHRIAEATQNPDLADIDGADSQYQNNFLERVSRFVFPSSTVDMRDEFLFQVKKCLEVIAAVSGPQPLLRYFSLADFQASFRECDSSNDTGKAWVVGIVGHVVSTICSRGQIIDGDNSPVGEYVERTAEWIIELLSSPKSLDGAPWQLQCAAATVDIALDAPFVELGIRLRGLRATLEWFELQDQESVMSLSAVFLRRLRAAVLTTRPLAMVS